MKKRVVFFVFMVICGIAGTFADAATAYVTKIAPYPNRRDSVQIYLGDKNHAAEEKRLDLFGEYVQGVLKEYISEECGIVYAHDGLESSHFTSTRLLAIILSDGTRVNVLDLFPHFNNPTLKLCFPYAFARRQHETIE